MCGDKGAKPSPSQGGFLIGEDMEEIQGRPPERHIDEIQRIIDACLADVEIVWYDPDEFPEVGPTGI